MAGPACRSRVLLEFDDTVIGEAVRTTRDQAHHLALNLVSGEKLGWQEPKAQSFTVSPLPCGSSAMHLGHRQVAKPTQGVTTPRFALAARSVRDWDQCC